MLTTTVIGPVYGMFHGNWCGIGHLLGPHGTALPPIDSLDAACMHHDQCIAVHGVGNCTCDRVLLQELRILHPHDPPQAIKARALYDAISWVPCLGPETIGKPLWFFGQLADDVHYGGPPPWDLLGRFFYTYGY